MDGFTAHKVLVLTALSLPLSAAIFTVNVTTDSIDSNTADGLCLDAAGKCSLRVAVMQANALAGVDTINLAAATYRLSITGTDNASTQGDLDITEAVTIQSAGMNKSIIDAQQVDRVFHLIDIASGETVTMNDLTIQNGMVSTGNYGGAGILHWPSNVTLDLKRVAFLGNAVGGILSDDNGGALKNLSTAYVTECLFQGNSADRGGAIYSNSNLIVNRSAFFENGAKAGGALLNYGSVSIVNSTFSRNSATNNGGAITNRESMSIYFCTIADNSAPTGGGINNVLDSNISIESSIIAYHGDAHNCEGVIKSLGHNMEDANTCTFNQSGDLINTDPQLDLLGFYGGATPTHRLKPTSPAINAGSLNTCFPIDQRGVKRPWGRGYDIGAYEWVGPNPSVLMYLLN
ncbi:MAG: hypothetical protein JXK05_00355 [Campylobacterales bacterium]|nr:hypothetical protein [Campylobacterales bacterium]